MLYNRNDFNLKPEKERKYEEDNCFINCGKSAGITGNGIKSSESQRTGERANNTTGRGSNAFSGLSDRKYSHSFEGDTAVDRSEHSGNRECILSGDHPGCESICKGTWMPSADP